MFRQYKEQDRLQVSSLRKHEETVATAASKDRWSGTRSVRDASRRRLKGTNVAIHACRQKKEPLSNPTPRRSTIDELVAAYFNGATIGNSARGIGADRTTIAGHLSRRGVSRCKTGKQRDGHALAVAALPLRGRRLARKVAAHFGINAATVANRFHRAGKTPRLRLGWT